MCFTNSHLNYYFSFLLSIVQIIQAYETIEARDFRVKLEGMIVIFSTFPHQQLLHMAS
jgi:hypothetical protein